MHALRKALLLGAACVTFVVAAGVSPAATDPSSLPCGDYPWVQPWSMSTSAEALPTQPPAWVPTTGLQAPEPLMCASYPWVQPWELPAGVPETGPVQPPAWLPLG